VNFSLILLQNGEGIIAIDVTVSIYDFILKNALFFPSKDLSQFPAAFHRIRIQLVTWQGSSVIVSIYCTFLPYRQRCGLSTITDIQCFGRPQFAGDAIPDMFWISWFQLFAKRLYSGTKSEQRLVQNPKYDYALYLIF
jgi:hypothetical protein